MHLRSAPHSLSERHVPHVLTLLRFFVVQVSVSGSQALAPHSLVSVAGVHSTHAPLAMSHTPFARPWQSSVAPVHFAQVC